MELESLSVTEDVSTWKESRFMVNVGIDMQILTKLVNAHLRSDQIQEDFR